MEKGENVVKKPKVFISQWMPPIGIAQLAQYYEVDHHCGEQPLSKDEFINRAQVAEALVVFVTDSVDAEIIAACPRLRIISSFGKGYDNIDIETCTSRGILVIVNPDTLTESTADLALALILAVSRGIVFGDRHVRCGLFKGWHPTNLLGKDFTQSNLGILGFGAIGQAIARRAAGFGVRQYYYDPSRKNDAEWQLHTRYCDLDTLLSYSDFLVIAANYTPNTHHLIDSTAIRKMRFGSYLINISRGSIVDEHAVAEGLANGQLGGYAADVFEFEDRLNPKRPDYIPDSLLSNGNTVFTPHLGTGTVEARERITMSTAEQLIAALRGSKPSGAINYKEIQDILPYAINMT